MQTLGVPPAAIRDESSINILSAWIAEKSLHCSMRIGIWQSAGRDEPASWGILLADVVRHLSNALSEELGSEKQQVIDAILSGLENELIDPTSEITGSFWADGD